MAKRNVGVRTTLVSAFLVHEFFVIGRRQQAVQLARILERHLEHPGLVRILINLLRSGRQFSIHLSHGARSRRIEIRHRLHRFYGSKGLPRCDVRTGLGQFDENDVTERFLRVIGDANGCAGAVNFDPLVLLGVLQVAWIGLAASGSCFGFSFQLPW